MTDLLVRDIPDELKQKLALRATENGRSQSAEALSILQDSLQPRQERGLFERLRELSEFGGIEYLDAPERHLARDFSFEEA